jgi:hypothetical protein
MVTRQVALIDMGASFPHVAFEVIFSIKNPAASKAFPLRLNRVDRVAVPLEVFFGNKNHFTIDAEYVANV